MGNTEDEVPRELAEYDAKCRTVSKCPFLDVHRRLNAVHRLWHQAQAAYDDLDAFTTNLNACIQALRSVTWVLQKAKRQIADFDRWYGPLQQRLRDDPVMRWLVAARNHVEKQGDLDTLSTVRAQVLASYGEAPVREFTVDPLKSTQTIAEELSVEASIPHDIRDNGVLVLERRWIAKDLPDHELLDALGHAFGVLSDVLSDAHIHVGLPSMVARRRTASDELESTEIPDSILLGRLPCMVEADTYRTVHVKLRTGEIGVTRKLKLRERTDSELREAARRYGYDAASPPLSRPASLRDEVNQWLDFAMRIMETDGYHTQLVLIRREGDSMQVVPLSNEDRADKYLSAQLIANDVSKSGADTVIMISESWMAPLDPRYPDRPPADSPDRIELLSVEGINASGDEHSAMVELIRSGGKLKFGEKRVVGTASNYLAPVRRAWSDRVR